MKNKSFPGKPKKSQFDENERRVWWKRTKKLEERPSLCWERGFKKYCKKLNNKYELNEKNKRFVCFSPKSSNFKSWKNNTFFQHWWKKNKKKQTLKIQPEKHFSRRELTNKLILANLNFSNKACFSLSTRALYMSNK